MQRKITLTNQAAAQAKALETIEALLNSAKFCISAGNYSLALSKLLAVVNKVHKANIKAQKEGNC